MKNVIFEDFFTANPWIFILIIVAVFGVIVIGVILVKKYSPHFKSDEKPKSEEEIAEEEVRRLTVPIDEEELAPKKKNMEAFEEQKKAAKAEEEKVPTTKEAADYESHRATEETGDASFEEQMKAYVASHPEEEKNAAASAEKSKDSKK